MEKAKDITSSKISWLLEVASKLSSILKSESKGLLQTVESVCRNDNAVFAQDAVASDGYTFLILSKDPKKLLETIIKHLRDANSPVYQSTLNPINIMVKLVDQEFMLDVNGTRLCYAITSPQPSNYLMKVIACKTILQINMYQTFIDTESNKMIEDSIKEVHPSFDYSIKTNNVSGGRKKPKNSTGNKKQNVRSDVVARIMQHVRSESKLADGIIFVGDQSEDTAATILYTDRKYKENLEAFINELVSKSYPSYSCKCFLHAEFKVPYDFRMRKHSVLMTDKKTKVVTYIANLYNLASYMPLPCTKSIVRDTFINKAHPLVKLMFLYIDMYSIECRTNAQQKDSQERIYINRMMKTYNEILAFEKTPTWTGVYMEEAYDKIKYNMKMRMSTSVETHFI